MENRHGLAVGGIVTQAAGTVEREASEAMLKAKRLGRRITSGEDSAYDTAGSVANLRDTGVSRIVTQTTATPKLVDAGAARLMDVVRAIPPD